MSEIQIGNVIKVIRGAFKDFEGVSHFTNNDIVVDLNIFGVQISVPLQLDDFDIEYISPLDSWASATAPNKGITPIMEFMAQHYGKTYKPNTRETVRRQTIHQFLDAALIVANSDEPLRPINSPKTVYQIEESALALLQTYGTPEWENSLRTYQASIETLKKRYAQERELSRILSVCLCSKNNY